MQLRVLFADDQIPDEELADNDVRAALKRKYPQAQEGFFDAFPIMREAVNTLRSAGYDVTVANTAKDALSLATSRHFDIAIIDMGWFGDLDLPERERDYFGWTICGAIDDTVSKTQSKPTAQIIYSDRFKSKPEMSREAAQKGKLPVFKVYGESGHEASKPPIESGPEALKASVKFIEQLIEREAQSSQQNVDLRSREVELEKRVAELESMLGRAAAAAPSINATISPTISATATASATSTVEQHLESSSKKDLADLLDELSKLSSKDPNAKALQEEGNKLMQESGSHFWENAKKYAPKVLNFFVQTVPLPPPAGQVIALANRFVQAVSGSTTS